MTVTKRDSRDKPPQEGGTVTDPVTYIESRVCHALLSRPYCDRDNPRHPVSWGRIERG